MITYIIHAPTELHYQPAAAALAYTLGCMRVIHEWNGVDELSPGACAYTNAHNTPPDGACVMTIRTAEEAQTLADRIAHAIEPPPHITHALQRIERGISGPREAEYMRNYIARLFSHINHQRNTIVRAYTAEQRP